LLEAGEHGGLLHSVFENYEPVVPEGALGDVVPDFGGGDFVAGASVFAPLDSDFVVEPSDFVAAVESADGVDDVSDDDFAFSDRLSLR